MISIAIYKPDIPQNTASILRLCACLGLKMHIIEPCGFNLNDPRFKRVIMAKKTHVKVRLVPEAKPDSPFFYYVKKPAGGEKAKVKLKARKYNPSTRKHETFVEKKLPPHSK